MTVIREIAGKWSCQVPTFDPLLQKGTQFVIEPKVLNRDHETKCQLLEWQFRIANPTATQQDKSTSAVSDLELIVKEIRPGRFESWFQNLSHDTQFWAPTTTAILCLFFGAAVLYTLYVQPTHGLVFVGKHARSAGCAIIILLFVFLLPIKFGLTRGSSNFRKPFFFALLVTSAWVLCAFWLIFSKLPADFHASDAEYVTYAKSLGQSMSRSYWPILVAALPWLSVSFKLFGLETAEKASEALEKIPAEK